MLQGSCPSLGTLDLSSCPGLEYVLIQSNSLKTIDLKGCALLSKALLHCPSLEKMSITGCSKLETLMLWSDRLTELDLTGGMHGWQDQGVSVCSVPGGEGRRLKALLKCLDSSRSGTLLKPAEAEP